MFEFQDYLRRSHDASFTLFHIGQRASPGVKQFAESGKIDVLENQQQWVDVQQKQQQQQQQQQSKFSSLSENNYISGIGSNQSISPSIAIVNNISASTSSSSSFSYLYNNNNNNNYNNSRFVSSSQFQAMPSLLSSSSSSLSSSSSSTKNLKSTKHAENSIFDKFDIPAITTGGGRNEAKFFVDGNHSLVSLMTRIVPSPDWFIGVDSLQLCVGGSWLDTVTVEMDPLDAGTDNGFTFTAPNWPTEPQGVIYRITSRYPAHPAGSFFYPKSKRLPPIATFQFIKLKEYELSEVFNFEEDERKYELVKTRTHLEVEHNHVEMNNELSASIEKERQSEVTVIPIANTEKERVRAKLLEKMNPSLNNSIFDYQTYSSQSSISSSPNIIAKDDKNALIKNIVKNYDYEPYEYSKSISKSVLNHKSYKKRFKSKDCRVSHWSVWSACSKTCGIGEMHRHRRIIKHGKRGGRKCPPLQESKWCGTARGCHSSPLTQFDWSNT
ncbi:serine/threonine-protein kinase phg2-like [Condylostylus longicornis]|uniref:serine/threonine-protein kinase phg2-like n=1 Tax=Condylostylus longicornis TaxID=2530218 RepID=UPI00244DB508|nr:serine/threonine-protein kinase phg2-like [Condylostylus longicornis]